MKRSISVIAGALLLVGSGYFVMRAHGDAPSVVAVGMIPATFSVALSGSSTYSIPIRVAPGTAGTQPQLQLSYNSQGSGGSLGAGWSVSGLSAITRGPRDGFIDGRPEAVSLSNSDALYLDGQRIVPIGAPTGSGERRQLEYRKVDDDFTQVRQYGSDLDHSYFRVRTKGGMTIIFGSAADGGAPYDDRDATVRFANGSAMAFAESLAVDSAGNFIRFRYEANNDGDYNVSEVDYTGHGSLDENGVMATSREPFANITFVYEAAPRPQEVYVAGQLIHKGHRLTDIYSCVSLQPFEAPFSCRGAASAGDGRRQAAHYRLEYKDTATAARFLLTKIRLFGADDSTELSPTVFNYTEPSPGWISSPYQLPSSLVLANNEKVSAGYRFVHFLPGAGQGNDLLFSAEIGGKNVAFAFKNNGPNAWVQGGTPWTELSSGDVDFSPPVPFVNSEGQDLGVLLVDVVGDGRTAIIQNNVVSTIASSHAYLAGAKKFEDHSEYQVPFVVSRDGKIVAHYFLAKWTGSVGPDLIFESEGSGGFLRNGGVGIGWQPDHRLDPPIPLNAYTHLVDFACNGKPYLIGVANDATGQSVWRVFRFETNKWTEDTSVEYKPKFPPTTNPEAIREIKFGPTSSSCAGLLVATAEGAGLHGAFEPTPTGWRELVFKKPAFDLVDVNGNPSRAVVANLDGTGYPGLVANTALPGGRSVSFAYTQDAAGWHFNSKLVPSVAIAADDPTVPEIHSFVGSLVRSGVDDVALLNDARPLSGDTTAERYAKFGRLFINDTTQFTEEATFAPPVAFTREDKPDAGVRFVDLHGTGLPDIVFSRLVTGNGRTMLVAGAYRNTGRGWVAEPGQCNTGAFDISSTSPVLSGGLCPPVPFAGDEVTGNPVQFVDLDGDGFLDLIYSYENKANKVVTKIYFNANDGTGGRKWTEQSPDASKQFIPPADVFPLASYDVGDMGVRFVKIDNNRLGILASFRKAPQPCPRIFLGLPIPNCGTLAAGALKAQAFSFDGTRWNAVPLLNPPIPFVTQVKLDGGAGSDLFVELSDVTGSGLPAIVASFTDPATNQVVNKVWINTKNGWDAHAGISVPYALDAAYREPKTEVQFADVNGDGLADILMTKGGCPGCSRTWLGTGAGWTDSAKWRIPDEAIDFKDGDPGFRLVDTKGDGYLDVLWIRQKDDGKIEKGLRLNNGNDWSNKAPDNVVPDLAFVDKQGVDQGVRILSITGKGLTDIVQSLPGHLQTVQLSRSRRSDILTSVVDGYGLRTDVSYEALSEVDGADPSSGNSQISPLGWRVYERGEPSPYPMVAPVPTTYVVRKASVDEGNGKPAVVDYRYGGYRINAIASRSLGFAWRESLNEESGVLNRTEFVQDARTHPGASRDATCIVKPNVLDALRDAALQTPGSTEYPSDLCPEGATTAFSWGYKIAESDTCWAVSELDADQQAFEFRLPGTAFCGSSASAGVSSRILIVQHEIAKAKSITYEVDGQTVGSTVDTFAYDNGGGVLSRYGDVINTKSELADGTYIETNNTYADDPSKWFLGRAVKTSIAKFGALTAAGTRSEETSTACFDYSKNTGLLSKQEVNCGTTRAIVTVIKRDGFGNITARTVSAAGEPSGTTQSTFDDLGRYHAAEIDALGHRSEVQNDPTTGQPTSVRDPNGAVSKIAYDSFGRVFSQTSATGVVATSEIVSGSSAFPIVQGTTDLASGANAAVRYAVKTTVGPLPATWALFDVKGRNVRKVTQGFSTDPTKPRYIFQDTEYDSLGRVLRASMPYDALETPKWTTNEYDDLGRVCAATAINGVRTETIYEGRPNGGGRILVVVDPRHQLTAVTPGGNRMMSCGRESSAIYRSSGLSRYQSSVTNMHKQVVEASDEIGRISYTYDAGGHVETTQGPTGAVTKNTYDAFGNKIAVSDPDLGTWRYEYDAFGRVTKQVDANGQTSTLEYDLLGRPQTRVQNDYTTNWQYDTANHGVGKLASIASSNGYKESYYYDPYGRVVTDAVNIDTSQLTTNTEYDELGRVTRVTYPSKLVVENKYDAKGFFVEVRDGTTGQSYWDAKKIDALGHVVAEVYGNSVSTIRSFGSADERLRSVQIRGRNSAKIMDLALEYDLIGNLRSRAEKKSGKQDTFEYDQANRLTAQVSEEGDRSVFRYDAAGRITFKSDVGSYSYASNPGSLTGADWHPFHAVEQTGKGRSRHQYKYDHDGNMISSRAGHFEYTSDNHLRGIFLDQKKWVVFDYAPSGDRFRQSLRDQDVTEETLYVGLYERVTDYAPSANTDYAHPTRFSGFERLTRHRSYLMNSAGVFAAVETDEMPANTGIPGLPNTNIAPLTNYYGTLTTQETWYLHADQLGSILCVTDGNGVVRDKSWYDAWGAREEMPTDAGARRGGSILRTSWKRGWIGQEHLDAFSLIHLNGRVYDPRLGMFTSVDPINAMTFDTQAGNGYAYARNNPLRYIDPSGFGWDPVGDLGRAIGGAATDIWHGATHAVGEAGKWVSENWRTLVVVAVVIGVTYLTLGTGTPEAITLGDAILAGAAAGAAGAAVGTALYGGTPDEIIQAAIKGGIIGGISAGAFYGIGNYFGAAEKMSTTSQIESMAAHGVVGGARESVEGGDFWKGFVATAATKASSIYGPQFDTTSANTAKAAVVGGTVAQLDGGKFANGAVTGAFSYAFNGALHDNVHVERGFAEEGNVFGYQAFALVTQDSSGCETITIGCGSAVGVYLSLSYQSGEFASFSGGGYAGEDIPNVTGAFAFGGAGYSVSSGFIVDGGGFISSGNAVTEVSVEYAPMQTVRDVIQQIMVPAVNYFSDYRNFQSPIPSSH